MGFVYATPAVVGGTVLIIERIESQNYVTNVSGWAIMADGTAEFFNVVVRGSLVTGVAPNQRIEFNGSAYPNEIAFFTGSSDETVPAGIAPVDSGGVIYTRYRGPAMLGVAAVTMDLGLNVLSGKSTFELDGDRFRFTSGESTTIESSSLRLSGDFTEYHNFATGFMDWEGETWHTVGAAGQPAFAGNWAVSGGVAVAFRKDSTGRVQLRGRATEGVALSATIFTLPVGYRPSQTMSWAVKANNDGGTIGWLSVTTAGAVTCIGNVAQLRVQTILDAISFPTT